MIVTIEIPGGSLAQGELLSQYAGIAVVDTGRDVLTGTLVPRVERGLQAQVGAVGYPVTRHDMVGHPAAKNRGCA